MDLSSKKMETMINLTIKLILNNKPTSDGWYSIFIRFIKDRKKKIINTGVKCEKKNFHNEQLTKQHKNHQWDNERLVWFKSRAYALLREYQMNQTDFTLDEFEQAFRGRNKTNELNVIKFFEEIIEEMDRAGRIGNAKAYKDTMVSLKKFRGDHILYKNITQEFLEKYEVFLRETGSANGGIAFKMRQFRALCNKARKRKLVPKEPYPFEEYKIARLKSGSRKISLTVEEFQKIKNVDLSENPTLVEAYNYFMFSIYTRGMNFHDMMLLKWSNIQNGRIYYTRAKTKGSINLGIIEPVQELLDYYRSQNRPTDYVFPILLSEGMTPRQIANRKHKVIQRYNKKLKELAALAGVDKKPSSYVARHSFATILKMSGTPIEKISEMMGHSNVSVTEAYLKEFSDDDLDNENLKFLEL